MVDPNPTQHKVYMTWTQFESLCNSLANKIKQHNHIYSGIYGIPRGGCIIAVRLSHLLNMKFLTHPKSNCLIVDDICDSGNTFTKIHNLGYKVHYSCLLKRYSNHQITPDFCSSIINNNNWIVFPWE